MQLYPGQVPHLLLQVTKSQTIKAILSLLSSVGLPSAVLWSLFLVDCLWLNPKKKGATLWAACPALFTEHQLWGPQLHDIHVDLQRPLKPWYCFRHLSAAIGVKGWSNLQSPRNTCSYYTSRLSSQDTLLFSCCAVWLLDKHRRIQPSLSWTRSECFFHDFTTNLTSEVIPIHWPMPVQAAHTPHWL